MRPIPSHWPLAVTAGSLAALIAIGAVAGAGLQEPRSDRERRALLENELNTIDIIERYGDSVVAVTVALQGQVFSPFAESTAPDAPPEPFSDEPVQASSGSGFLIEYRKEPFLVTNYHVVESALEPASARLLDGAEVSVTFPADPEQDVAVEVVGVNPSYDLALLRRSPSPSPIRMFCKSGRRPWPSAIPSASPPPSRAGSSPLSRGSCRRSASCPCP
jgi:S1-C subfamily serine protease